MVVERVKGWGSHAFMSMRLMLIQDVSKRTGRLGGS